MFLNQITVLSFGACYALALALEVLQLLRPRPLQQLIGLTLGMIGLLGQTIYILAQQIPFEAPFGSLLILAWILAVFYLYGSLHHRRLAWGLFVLPVVLTLIALAAIFSPNDVREPTSWTLMGLEARSFWGYLHGLLFLLAAVGVCVGFVASLMYLVQSYRLRAKLAPTPGLRTFSLERIESMNRRAILWAFPLLTAGLLLGLLLQDSSAVSTDWFNPKILSAIGLWIVFAILLYVRYAVHAGGRKVAFLTALAFTFLLFAMVSVHSFGPGGSP